MNRQQLDQFHLMMDGINVPRSGRDRWDARR
jgi:hypothetical protein